MTRFQRFYSALLLAFLSILSVSGTIALRNLLHLTLLVMIGLSMLLKRKELGAIPSIALIKKLPTPIWLWCIYLLLFPMFAIETGKAFSNLLGNGMWGESILTLVLAVGSLLILSPQTISLWVLALVSAVPVFIHLGLTLLAWAGVLQPAFYAEPTLQTVASSLISVIQDFSLIQSPFHAFPMGFRGIEPMHGNLGYPASQAMCLALAVFFSAWQKSDRSKAIQSSLLVALCFVSVVIAQSRAAAYFGLIIVAFAAVLYFDYARVQGGSANLTRGLPVITMFFGAFCLALFLQVVMKNPVWYSMLDKLVIGFQVENPRDVLCDGITSNTVDIIRQTYADRDESYVDTLIDGLRGDGARVLLARVGVELVSRNPFGLNGGRDAYQYRIAELCKHEPIMFFSHAHNAWVNLILAIGWVGALLYAWVLLGSAFQGWKLLRHPSQWPYGIALLLLSVFWILRGMVDAVYQEHYLQMQAFFLLFLWLQSQLDDIEVQV